MKRIGLTLALLSLTLLVTSPAVAGGGWHGGGYSHGRGGSGYGYAFPRSCEYDHGGFYPSAGPILDGLTVSLVAGALVGAIVPLPPLYVTMRSDRRGSGSGIVARSAAACVAVRPPIEVAAFTRGVQLRGIVEQPMQ